jgi:adenosylcobinamide-GDP ribazoletransferase
MLAYASLFVLLPLLYLRASPLWYALLNAAVVAAIMGLYFKRRLGGYSGDCLGATQQVTEVVVYLSLLGSWNSL